MKNMPDVRIDSRSQQVYVNFVPVHIPKRTLEVLAVIINAKGACVSREKIIDIIWGQGSGKFVKTNAVDQHVHRLRKVYGIGDRIETKSLWGYRWAI